MSIRESILQRDVDAKAAAFAAGRAAGEKLLDGKPYAFAAPQYDDPYLAHLWHYGFGQAIVSKGRDIAGLNFRRADGTETGEGKVGKQKAAKELPTIERRGW